MMGSVTRGVVRVMLKARVSMMAPPAEIWEEKKLKSEAVVAVGRRVPPSNRNVGTPANPPTVGT